MMAQIDEHIKVEKHWMVINIEIVLVLNKDKNIPKFNKFFLIYFSNILKLSYN